MSFPNILNISEEETFNTYTTEKVPVGSLARVEDGRLYRFSEVGATALVVNDMNQGTAPSANFQTEAVGTLAAGVPLSVLARLAFSSSASATSVGAARSNFTSARAVTFVVPLSMRSARKV